MKFFSSLILLPLFLTAISSHGEDINKIDCPGIVDVDGKTYIGGTNDLEPLSELYNYTYTAYCEVSTSTDLLSIDQNKISAAYKCDFGILGTCQGYIVNSNYVFWDHNKRQFIDPTQQQQQQQQCHLITSCHQLQDVCDTRNYEFSCGMGEYVCHPLHSDDGTLWCQGTVLSATDPEPCPEQVTGCHELLASFDHCDCTLHAGTEYWCYDDYRDCRGNVVAATVPVPTRTANNENQHPKPDYIPPEQQQQQRPGGTVLTLANVDDSTIAAVAASPKPSTHHAGNRTRTLCSFGLLVGVVAVVAYRRRLRSKDTPPSSGGAAGDYAVAEYEYELGAYENSLTDDF